jgi:hypothetical protein
MIKLQGGSLWFAVGLWLIIGITPVVAAESNLKQAFADDFKVGAAVARAT